VHWVAVSKALRARRVNSMFAIVAGMMVYIVLAQLLPAAHKYDPQDQLTTLCATGGMAAMAASLVVFQA
jgi:zinc transporter ZupT